MSKINVDVNPTVSFDEDAFDSETEALYSNYNDKYSKFLNNDKALFQLMSTAWETFKQYTVGMLVEYQGKIYSCKTEHLSTEEITPEDDGYWEDTNLMDVLNTISTKVNDITDGEEAEF